MINVYILHTYIVNTLLAIVNLQAGIANRIIIDAERNGMSHYEPIFLPSCKSIRPFNHVTKLNSWL